MVDINDFCRLLRVERNPFVERLFSMFDTDRGGLVELKEFIIGAARRLMAGKVCSLRTTSSCPVWSTGLVNVSGDVREDKVRFAFELFDLDGSGFIDANELRKIVRATNLASENQVRAARGIECCLALSPLTPFYFSAMRSSRVWHASSPTWSSLRSASRPA